MTIAKYNNKGDIIYVCDKESKKITAIETINYSLIKTYEGHNGVIWSIDISSDDSILISCSGDMNIIVWDIETCNILNQLNTKNIPKCVSLQKNTKKNLLVIYNEAISKRLKSNISIYDLDNMIQKLDNNGLIKEIEWTKEYKPSIITWMPEEKEVYSKLIIGCENGNLIVKDINSDEEVNYNLHNDSIKSIVFDKLRSKILTSSLDKTAKQINLGTFEVLKTYESNVPINYAIYNNNDRKIILGGGIEAMMIAKTSDNDLNIKFYRTNDSKLINHMSSHFGPVRCLDKSPNDKNFISASQDGMLKIYMMNDIDEENKINKINNNETDKINNNETDKIKSNEINKSDDSNDNIEINKCINNIKNLYLSDELNRLEYLNIKTAKPKVEEINKHNLIVGMPGYKNANKILNEKKESNIYIPVIKSTTIKINNLPKDIRVKDLLDIYEFYGRIDERGVNIKNYTENTIAFIRYISHESANKAIIATNGLKFQYCILDVELANN